MEMKTETPTAGELMNRKVHSVTPDFTLIQLIDFFQKHGVTSVPVVDSDNHLIGFVSEGDALDMLTNAMFYHFPNPPAVRNCMKRHPVSIEEDVDLFVVASLLVSHGYRHVPVVDSSSRLIGLVSRRETLQAMRMFNLKKEEERNAEYFPPDLAKIINHSFIMSSH